jgi:acyl carrier protein
VSAATSGPEVLAELARILAELTGDSAVLDAPPGTPLLRDGIGLNSVGGALLLVRVQARFGVDVADEDLNLDSLATIGTLAAFVADRMTGR